MTRWIGIAVAAVLMAGVLFDPYTFRRTASDFIEVAPLWQMALGLTDAILLTGGGVLLWRKRAREAFWLFGGEMLYALALGIGFVERDGVARFVAGIGAEQYLTLYFGTLALRVLLLLLAHRLAGQSRHAGYLT